MDLDFSYIAHIISICNAVIAVLVMQLKNMKSILIGHITINFISGVSFFLLGGYSAASIGIVAIIQCIVMYFYDRKGIKPHLPVVVLFMLGYIACSVFNYQSPVDVLASLAALFFAIGVANTNPSIVRLWNSLNPLTWMIYDIFIDGYGALVMHACIFTSIVIAIIRLDIIPKYKAKKENSNG